MFLLAVYSTLLYPDIFISLLHINYFITKKYRKGAYKFIDVHLNLGKAMKIPTMILIIN